MIQKAGGEGLFIKADVSKANEVEALIKKTVEAYGRLDCAFNNAGMGIVEPVPFSEHTEEVFDKVISVNLKGVWLCMKYEIRQMVTQGGGVIVNNSSLAGLRPVIDNHPAYVAAKHGVIGLTRRAALECGKSGIRVNAVCPGPVRTPLMEAALHKDPGIEARLNAMLPLGRMGSPDDVAEMVVWLCSNAASWVTGEGMLIDGGMFLL
jgi:NAD(P)-dependent dehydrogenase (short-subunit alcohol dehydrogenase family)